MTEKRYFKRTWEEEYYIFDSNTISEEEFDEKMEYENYQAFADSMTGEEVLDRLNHYSKQLIEAGKLIENGVTITNENRRIKQIITDMIESERTELRKQVLKQLWSKIQ